MAGYPAAKRSSLGFSALVLLIEGAIDTPTRGAIDTPTRGAIDTLTRGAIDTLLQRAIGTLIRSAIDIRNERALRNTYSVSTATTHESID
jgi:hypothetical protein